MAVLTAACGSDGADTADPVDATTPLALTAIDFAYTGVRPEVPVGTEITLTNDSTAELHEVVAIRLPDDEERPVDELMRLPPDELQQFFPLVSGVLVAPPAADGVLVEGSATLDEPGRYALICVVPTGADPEEYLAAAAEADGGPPQVAGGPPHIAQGMFAEVTVVD